MIAQHDLLDRVAGAHGSEGNMRQHAHHGADPAERRDDAARARKMVESHGMTGKVVVSGF